MKTQVVTRKELGGHQKSRVLLGSLDLRGRIEPSLDHIHNRGHPGWIWWKEWCIHLEVFAFLRTFFTYFENTFLKKGGDWGWLDVWVKIRATFSCQQKCEKEPPWDGRTEIQKICRMTQNPSHFQTRHSSEHQEPRPGSLPSCAFGFFRFERRIQRGRTRNGSAWWWDHNTGFWLEPSVPCLTTNLPPEAWSWQVVPNKHPLQALWCQVSGNAFLLVYCLSCWICAYIICSEKDSVQSHSWSLLCGLEQSFNLSGL